MKNPNVEPKYVKPLKKICMTIGELPSSYLESMSYYEMLVWFVEFLKNQIIPALNNNAEAVQELQQLYVELKDYVDNYFDNLDVQEEINNKLDEMVEDGTLEDLITNKLNLINIFDSFNDVIENKNKLKNNMIIETLGYYSKNDGGKGLYQITNSLNSDYYQEDLENGLYATLLVENNTINFLQIGAKKEDKENNLYDNKDYLEKYVDFVNSSSQKYKLFVPAGIYGFSETNIITNKGIDIIGIYSYSQWLWCGTIFVPFNDNQDYILKLGEVATSNIGVNIKDIQFSSAYFEYDESSNSFKIQTTGESDITYNNIKNINGYALDILHTVYSKYENLDFRYIIGGCLNISSSWELDFNKINIRKVWNLNSNLINLDTNNSSIANSNITALNINEIFAEAIIGTVLNINSGCTFANSRIGLINIEPNRVEFFGDINTNLTDSFTDSYTSVPLINISNNCTCNDIIINNIQINNIAWVVTTYNYINYIYDTIIKLGKSSTINPIINNISVIGQRKNVNALLYNETTTSPLQNITINNIKGNSSTYNLLLNVLKLYNITVNNISSIETNLKLNNSLLIPCYKMNYISPSRSFGNITYDADAITTEKLCVNFIDRVSNPNININEIRGFLPQCEKMFIRVKAPDGESGVLSVGIINSAGQSQGSVTATITGDGTFKWYEFDISSLTSLDFTDNLSFTVYPGQTVDFEMLADVMYIK